MKFKIGDIIRSKLSPFVYIIIKASNQYYEVTCVKGPCRMGGHFRWPSYAIDDDFVLSQEKEYNHPLTKIFI